VRKQCDGVTVILRDLLVAVTAAAKRALISEVRFKVDAGK
jgi:hypothetical protein